MAGRLTEIYQWTRNISWIQMYSSTYLENFTRFHSSIPFEWQDWKSLSEWPDSKVPLTSLKLSHSMLIFKTLFIKEEYQEIFQVSKKKTIIIVIYSINKHILYWTWNTCTLHYNVSFPREYFIDCIWWIFASENNLNFC